MAAGTVLVLDTAPSARRLGDLVIVEERIVAEAPPEPVELVSRIFTRENAEEYLRDAVR